MELEKARAIAQEIVYWLTPTCERIVITGSIRRRKPEVGDIELLCIPECINGIDYLDKMVRALVTQRQLDFRRNKLGSRVYGPKNKLMVHLPSGIGVDVFTADEVCWPVALVVRTGGEKTNKRIATAALRKSYRLHAYGSGFSTSQGNIVCDSEREVFEAVDLPYLEPWERD